MMLLPYLQRALPKPLATAVWLLYAFIGILWLSLGRRVVNVVGSVVAAILAICAGLHFVLEMNGENEFFTWFWQTFVGMVLLGSSSFPVELDLIDDAG